MFRVVCEGARTIVFQKPCNFYEVVCRSLILLQKYLRAVFHAWEQFLKRRMHMSQLFQGVFASFLKSYQARYFFKWRKLFVGR